MKTNRWICFALIAVMLLGICGCGQSGKSDTPDTPQTPEETPVQAAPEPTPEPEPETTPEPTPEPEPEPTPEPTPEPVGPAPEVTKHPTGEVVIQGGSAYFIARAENATDIAWFITSPDGSRNYNAGDISKDFPNLNCTGTNTETLGIFGIDAALNGWRVTCRFTGPGGSATSDAAIITVVDYEKAAGSLEEVLVRIVYAKPSGTAGASLSQARDAAQIADFFSDSGLTAQEVRETVNAFTLRLNDEHRTSYKENVVSIIESYRLSQNDPDSFRNLLSDAGYEAVRFPWDNAKLSPLFDALRIG